MTDTSTISLITQNLAACSCEINKTAKGDFTFSVKAYAGTVEEAVAKALTAAKEVKGKIEKELFPSPCGV